MAARDKLNGIYITRMGLIAAIPGVIFENFSLFLACFAALIGIGIYSRDLRF